MSQLFNVILIIFLRNVILIIIFQIYQLIIFYYVLHSFKKHDRSSTRWVH